MKEPNTPDISPHSSAVGRCLSAFVPLVCLLVTSPTVPPATSPSCGRWAEGIPAPPWKELGWGPGGGNKKDMFAAAHPSPPCGGHTKEKRRHSPPQGGEGIFLAVAC